MTVKSDIETKNLTFGAWIDYFQYLVNAGYKIPDEYKSIVDNLVKTGFVILKHKD